MGLWDAYKKTLNKKLRGKMKKGFEDFLMERHAEDYIGTKDSMVDDFGDWISNLSPDEFIEYGDLFAIRKQKDFRKKALSKIQEMIDWLNCW